MHEVTDLLAKYGFKQSTPHVFTHRLYRGVTLTVHFEPTTLSWFIVPKSSSLSTFPEGLEKISDIKTLNQCLNDLEMKYESWMD